jgi:hypothetical protein
MNNAKTGQLSKAELREMHQAQREIEQAQRRISRLLQKHLDLRTSEGLELKKIIHHSGTVINAEKDSPFTLIYEGCCKLVGVYKDPPGICIPV